MKPDRRDPARTPRRVQTGGGRRRSDMSMDAVMAQADLPVILRSVVETVAVGICIVDSDSRIQFANREAERILGVPRQRMVGNQIGDLTTELRGADARAVSPSARPSVRAMRQNRPVYGVHHTFLRPDGHRIHLSINAAPLREQAGAVTGAVVSLQDDTDRVETGAELAAMDRARRQLIDRLVSAQEEERRRIAVDMHDDSLQVMGAISLRLARVRRRSLDDDTRAAMDELQATVELAARRLRQLLFNLRPPVLDRDGVAAALREYLQQLRGDTGVHYRLHDRLVSQPHQEQGTHLFRIAQEALANVRKHSRAGRVDVSLDSRWRGSMLTIRDDGVGFDIDRRHRPDSLGLLAMRERAEMLGGWCQVTSAEGEGTRIRVWIPDLAAEQTA